MTSFHYSTNIVYTIIWMPSGSVEFCPDRGHPKSYRIFEAEVTRMTSVSSSGLNHYVNMPMYYAEILKAVKMMIFK